MNRDELRAYLLSKPQAVEEHPFGPGTSVYKVAGKMFALLPDEGPLTVSLKCEPNLALLLRENHPAVIPGYHLNKRHWNTVKLGETLRDTLADDLADDEVREMIDHSYDQVVKGLPKRVQAELQREYNRKGRRERKGQSRGDGSPPPRRATDHPPTLRKRRRTKEGKQNAFAAKPASQRLCISAQPGR